MNPQLGGVDFSGGPGDLIGPILATHGPTVAAVGVVVTAALAVAGGAVTKLRHRRLHSGARLVTVLAPPRLDPDGAKALWGNLSGLLRPRWRRLLSGQPHLAFEYRITAAGAVIQMWVPGPVPPGLVEHAITAAWPGATTRTRICPAPARVHPATTHTRSHATDTDTAKPARGSRWPCPNARTVQVRAVVTGGVLRLARSGGLPIGEDTAGDPIAAVLAAAGDLPEPPTDGQQKVRDEVVVVQVLARPVPARRAGRGLTGHPRSVLLDTVSGGVGWLIRELAAILAPGPIRPAHPHPVRSGSAPGSSTARDPRARLERSSSDRAAVHKARAAGFDTLIRYAASTHHAMTGDTAHDRDQARRARRVVRGRAGAVAAVFASFRDHNFYRHHHLHRPARAIAQRRLRRGDLLSVAELAAVATLPSGPAPTLARAGARSIAPPPGIPRPGAAVKPLGDTTTHASTTSSDSSGSGVRARGRPVGVRVADARHHLHVIGATGSGKSTLLVQMVLHEIRHRRGIAVIDPKGDLITDVWNHLPDPVRTHAIVIDPDRAGPPPNLNPLTLPRREPDRGAIGSGDGGVQGRSLAVENIVAICRGVFAAYWGPRTDDVMRAACLTLIGQPEPRSLADLPDLLTDRDFRATHLRAITDPVLHGFWRTYNRLSDGRRAEMTGPLLNKVRSLLLRPFTRSLLTAAHPRRPHEPVGPLVDMHQILNGGVLLARIPKGSLGEEGTRLVGSIIVAHLWAATTARARLPQHQRADAGLVIDECHNFLHLPTPVEDLLAEARGLRLSLTLAHQNLDQLPRDLRAAIATNARNKLFFTVGPDNARDLARHTLPHLDDHDLAHLDAFHAAARLVHHDAETPAFTLRTRPLPRTPHRPGTPRGVPAPAARTQPAAASPRDRRRPQGSGSRPAHTRRPTAGHPNTGAGPTRPRHPGATP